MARIPTQTEQAELGHEDAEHVVRAVLVPGRDAPQQRREQVEASAVRRRFQPRRRSKAAQVKREDPLTEPHVRFFIIGEPVVVEREQHAERQRAQHQHAHDIGPAHAPEYGARTRRRRRQLYSLTTARGEGRARGVAFV